MQNKFTQKAKNALKNAQIQAGSLGHAYIGSEHLLLGLLSEKDSIAARVLSSRGIDLGRARGRVSSKVGEGEKAKGSGPTDMTDNARRIVEGSALIASDKGCSYVGTEHMLASLLETSSCTAIRIIEELGASVSLLRADLNSHKASLSPASRVESEENTSPKKPRPKLSPLLSLYTRDLTQAAADGKTDPTIGRTAETQRVIRILSRRQKNNPCLVGEPGVGKTAVVEGLATLIAEGKVPPTLEGKRILCLDIAAMIAGAKYRGEFEDRIKNVLTEAENDPSILLFIDELHVIVGAGAAEGAVDAANILKPALARGGVRVIGATTLTEYKKHIEKDAALERRFQPVFVEEPDEDTAILILRGLRPRYEEHHRLKISDGAINAAVRLSSRYINDRYLPDKALDLIDEAAAEMSIAAYAAFPDVPLLESELSDLKRKKEELIFAQDFAAAAVLRDKETEKKALLDARRREMKKKKNADLFRLDEEQIAEVVRAQTGIPVSRLLGSQMQALAGLEQKLRARVIGQDEAISSVCRAIRRGRVGLSAPGRPVGSFIFLGKTGVGKTGLAVAVAEELLGSRNALIRFDMSEFMEEHSVSRLIGSPPGYVGYGEGGQLTEAVRRRPYCVLLFDEIEKAHPKVFDLLLQILEDGKLTDAQGRVVSFSGAIVIMTSNLGSSEKKITGFIADSECAKARKERMSASLRDKFRPEFLDRVDEVAVFNDLDGDVLGEIANGLLGTLGERAEGLGVRLDFSPAVTAHLAHRCLAEGKGARPLRRMITSAAEDLITDGLLSGAIKSGDSVHLDVENEEIVIAQC